MNAEVEPYSISTDYLLKEAESGSCLDLAARAVGKNISSQFDCVMAHRMTVLHMKLIRGKENTISNHASYGEANTSVMIW